MSDQRECQEAWNATIGGERDRHRACVPSAGEPLAEDDRVMDIHDLSVHVGCAAYRRRRGRR